MKVTVLLAAGGAAWEAGALEVIDGAASRLMLLKRCLDLSDLLAAASAGSAAAAVIGVGVPGLDVDVVSSLRRSGITVVVVGAGGERLGVDHVIDPAGLPGLPGLLEGAAPLTTADLEPAPVRTESGQVIAVWGPTGAPGRTTVAVGLAAELAHRGQGTLLLDADPYGGSVAQHLGVLDQVSGLLAAARLANAGMLDAEHLALSARRVHDNLRLLSGLPRADRWVEVRGPAYDRLLETATALESHVVVDTGFCVEQEADAYSTASGRHEMTIATLQRADQLVVVGSADPVGLTRLVRALVDLSELVPGPVPVVVVNRMRGSLGWSERDVAATVGEVAPTAAVHFLPDDRQAADKALMAGRTLVELGDSQLRRGLAAVVESGLRTPVESRRL